MGRVPSELAADLFCKGMRTKKSGSPSFTVAGERHVIPTYGQVFDWLAERGAVVTLEPFFTFALAGNTAYTWKISYVDENYGGMKIWTESDKWDSGKPYGGSFPYQADDAIKFALTLI